MDSSRSCNSLAPRLGKALLGTALRCKGELQHFVRHHSATEFRREFDRYQRNSRKYPLRTQVLTAGVIGMVGDMIIQRIETQKLSPVHRMSTSVSPAKPIEVHNNSVSIQDNNDWVRTARMVVYRAAIFTSMDSLFLNQVTAGTAKKAVLWKYASAQLLAQPPVLCLFYFAMALLEGRSINAGVNRASDMLVPTLTLTVPLWTFSHIATFTVIPAAHRVAWVLLVQCAWTGVLSHLNSHAPLEGSAGTAHS